MLMRNEKGREKEALPLLAKAAEMGNLEARKILNV
jgi:hypothetical protein